MRKVELYGITVTETYVAGDRIDYYHMGPIQPLPTGELARPINHPLAKRETLPVHHIRSFGYDGHVEKFIAIKPELRELLEAPFKNEVAEARNEMAEQLNAKIEALRRIRKFNNLPWHQRLWYVLRGKLV